MQAVILNGSRDDDSAFGDIERAVISELTARNCTGESLMLRDMSITHCVGCFECWVKTPGVCRFNDDAVEIAKKIIASDVLIFLTPVTFGGYSSELKKALDRIICLLSPFFTTLNGETHHKRRYETSPALMGIGVMAQPDSDSESIFKNLVTRNAINLHSPAHVGGIVVKTQPADQKHKTVQSLFTTLEAWR